MSNGVLLLVRLGVSVTGVAVFTWVGWKLGGKGWALIGLVFSCPLIGVAIARPLVELSHEGLGWLHDQALGGLDGIYYEYNGVRVRVYEHDGRLWFVARDVMRAAGVPRLPDALLTRSADCAPLPGTRLMAFTLEGVQGFVDGRGPQHNGIALWAEREVVKPWVRKKEVTLSQGRGRN